LGLGFESLRLGDGLGQLILRALLDRGGIGQAGFLLGGGGFVLRGPGFERRVSALLGPGVAGAFALFFKADPVLQQGLACGLLALVSFLSAPFSMTK
jgi:hypothetical protein